MERLQKVIARANVASRRKAEAYIREGRVRVNGKVVTELGTKVSPADLVEVDGKRVDRAARVYYLMNKPTGIVTTTDDEKGRKTVIDLLDPEDREVRVYPVGRLDFDTAGLLLLTNDGELTERLTHPRHDIEKEYLVRVDGIVIRNRIRMLRKGVKIDSGRPAIPKSVSLLELDKKNRSTLLSVVITEGRNKQIRRMIEAIGHRVKKLTRVRYDFLTLDGVERGSYRPLKIHEIKRLYGHTVQKN
ncbi:MAG: pseudouridine synthase [Acholeplasmataceae bacterium]